MDDIQKKIKVKGQKLGNVASFKYRGVFVSDNGSKPEVLSRIMHATAALTKFSEITIKCETDVRSLVISMFLYACETRTLTAELDKRTQALR